MEQSAPATVSMAIPDQASDDSPMVDTPAPADSADQRRSVGFSERGRMRRRARFLRKARELAYRDLGGLVFNLHHFGQRNDTLVLAKLGTLGQIDTELRTLEGALEEYQPVTVLRDAGIAACPRCAAIHGSEDRFCPNCGLAMDRHAERPVAGPPQSSPPPSQPAPLAPAPRQPSVAAQAPAQPAPATSPPPASAPASPAPQISPAPASPAASPAPATQAPVSAPDPQPNPRPAPVAPAAPAPADQTTIDRPAATPVESAPAPPAAQSSATPSPAPTDPDQPTVIVRPSGSDA